MVSVESPLAVIFVQQLHNLRGVIGSGRAWPSPELGLALYAFTAVGEQSTFPVAADNMSLGDRRRLAEAPVLAAVGYVLASLADHADERVRTQWAEGLNRLAGRDPFPHDRNSFFYRPAELLGVCLGARSCECARPQDLDWLRGVVQEGERKLATADWWAYMLSSCSTHVLGVQWTERRHLQPRAPSVEESALSVWICAAYPAVAQSLGIADSDTDRQARLLRHCATEVLPQVDAGRAAILHVALRIAVHRFVESATERHWRLSRTGEDAIAIVEHLCSRFDLFARELQSRYSQRTTIEFKDEYDVQDALHALLKLHFDDVRSEDWVPSYGGSASRTDFLLKREQIIVETKMTRKNLGQKEIADQLIIDTRRYQSHQDCKTLICFVYDPGHLCHNPVALEHDLSSVGSAFRVNVIVAPKGL